MSGVAVIGVALVTAMSAAGTAAAAPGVSEDTITSPQAMVLHGSNGFGVAVDAWRGGGSGAHVVVSAYRGRDVVRYTARADLAGEGIHARLGPFGRIEMRWVPDGRLGEVSFACHGHGPRRQFLFDRGAYVGTLRFRGGNGFTAVRAHRVEWRRAWYDGNSTCRREAAESIPGPGKILQADVGHPDPSHRFVLYQPKSGARVEYGAYDRETVGRVEVQRSTWTYGAPRTFTSSSDFDAATIDPPAPFAGAATFARTEGARGTWLGDLTVDFPDGAEVPMAGSPFAATFYSGAFEGDVR